MPTHNPKAHKLFEILVREHADMLTAFLRSIVRSPSDVDDLFQEAMMVAWRRLDDFDQSRPFAPWLRGIAANCAFAAVRRGRAAPLTNDPAVLEALEGRYAALSRRPGDTFGEQIAAMTDCLSRLPEAMREALELAYGRGLLLRQIAEMTGQMEETLKKRVQRARQAVADCLAPVATTQGAT